VPNKNSDFSQEFSDLFEFLPEVFRSSTNESVFNNAFNRLFSKPEIERANGLVGNIPPALQNRQIEEPTPHRQAFQLQPLLNTRIGGQNFTASYVDLLNELDRLGVDLCRQKIWGSAKSFNWIPPIDLDKLINFRDYFWVDPVDPSSPQQYVTIENRCTRAQQFVAAYQETLDLFGTEFDVVDLSAADNTITVGGDQTELFRSQFRFFVRGSTNSSINNTFFTTLSSSFDPDTETTIIVVDQAIASASPVDGVVSLTELLTLFFLERTCLCDGDIGWDQGVWDGNNLGFLGFLVGAPTGTFNAISQNQNAAGESAPGRLDGDWVTAGNGGQPPELTDIWYDLTDGSLKQFDGANWVVVVANFQDILDYIQSRSEFGELFWDRAGSCETETNQWIEQNRWVHKNAVNNTATARQATQPIIEYSAQVQLNEWNFRQYVWKYRASQFTAFAESTLKPSIVELEPLKYLITDSTTIVLPPELGDQTATFVPGFEFAIEGSPAAGNNIDYVVSSSEFVSDPGLVPTGQAVTKITINGTFATFPTLAGPGRIIPVFTSFGDPWRNYNEHWLLSDTLDTVPVTPKLPNPDVNIDPTSTVTPILIDSVYSAQMLLSSLVDPTAFGDSVYRYAVEYTITQPGGVPAGTSFPIDSVFADPTLTVQNIYMDQRAVVGQNDIRVFVDGIRQYGQFVEDDNGGTSSYVVGVIFDNDIPANSNVRIEVGPPSALDLGFDSIEVRTIEDETQFGTDGPELRSLVEYRRSEQVKTATTQYPLFDVVNVDGTDAFQANSLFRFKTSQDSPVNPLTGFRLEIGPNGNYVFEQLLLKDDGERMLAFLLNGTPQTIWREGLNGEVYVPEYVDTNRNPLPVNDPEGFWEIPDQLYFNSEHENRREINLREIVSHFSSIIAEQASLPGIVNPGNTFYLLLNPNYGLGGLIKEHNFSYDTLLSALFVDNVTPRGVIDFAHQQYLNSLSTLKEIYRDNVVSYLTNPDVGFISELGASITEDVIRRYETNDYLAVLYGDSNAYDAATDQGVRNWPATLPFVRMAFARRPHLIEDTELSLLQLIHHDGHRSAPALTQTTREALIQTTINAFDPRSLENERWGIQSSSAPPTTFVDLSNATTPRAGIYWYQAVGSNRTLFRFAATAVSALAPIDVGVGALWYDTSTNTLRRLDTSSVWQPVTAVGDGLIGDAWEEVDLDRTLAQLLLEVETRLYDFAPELEELAFDVPALATSEISCPDVNPTITEADTFNQYLQDAFVAWLRTQEIDEAFSSAQFYDPADPFTWNYKQSIPIQYPRTGQTGTGGWWLDLYNRLYNTPYPHLEPWRLQGYDEKPAWWDDEYLDTSGARRWIYDHATASGMWENIRVGAVPAGQLLPDGVSVGTGLAGDVPFTYNYFSVNIDDSVLDGYAPDDVFPPYWDYVANGGSAVVRSLYQSISEIVAPSADYAFGDRGPVEFEWTQTAQRLYDDLTVGFRMDPVRFFHATFGEEFIDVGGLNINVDLEKVYSHKDVRFHGDIQNVNQVLSFEGLNQWYVNFNRSSGFDTVASNFRPLWTNWNPLLAYQFGSVIDTNTFTVDTPNFDVNARDYRVVLKNSIGIDNLTFDALKVSVLRVPNRLISQDTESLWNFQLDTFAPDVRQLSYYNVRNYPVRVATTPTTGSSIFSIYEYNITALDQITGVITLLGNQTEAFSLNNDFTITQSAGNNGSYTATNVVYDSGNDVTYVSIGTSFPSPAVDGVLVADYRKLQWQVGDPVEISSTIGVPVPLQANTTYYVIPVSDTSFQLAESQHLAHEGVALDVTTRGQGRIEVGQISYRFVALDGEATDREWKHFVLDHDSLLTITPPTSINGVQNLINIVDGYAAVEREEGFVFNSDHVELDPDLRTPISWETETERFIDSIFRLRSFRQAQPETFQASVDILTDEYVFSGDVPNWVTGQLVQPGVLNGTVPTPLLPNNPYFLITTDDPTRVKLALTRTDALLGNAIALTAGGSGPQYLAEFTRGKYTIPSYEINPARTNLWVETPRGILADISKATAADLRGIQLITDQNGNQLTTEQLAVFRLDRLARINVQKQQRNPELPAATQNPTRDSLHIASANLFVNGTEHVVLFNDNSVEGFLIYDPFVGLNTSRFELLFFRQREFTQRPVVGGYYLTQDQQLLRNIESSTLDLQNAYDKYRSLESTDMIREGRKSIGYPGAGTQPYLTELNVSPKSQFAFWTGFIASKGAVQGLNAFANSRTFDGAEVDEVWAFKIAEFGSNREQEYIPLRLIESDGRRVEKRIQFLDPTQDRVADTPATFEGIFLSDQARWADQPDQVVSLADNGTTFYFDTDITGVHEFTTGFLGTSGQYFIRFEDDVFFDAAVVIKIASDGTPQTPTTAFTYFNSQHVVSSTDPAAELALDPGAVFRLYAINPHKNAQNPAKVIDTVDNIVISDVPLWDPRRNSHYAVAENVVTIESPNDPATYGTSLDPANVSNGPWVEPQVGETWWDTSAREYVPYHDTVIFPDVDTRSRRWGQLSEWADIVLYQWTESDVPPEEYDAAAEREGVDITRDPRIRKSGTAKADVFTRTRAPLTVVSESTSTNDIFINDSAGVISLGDQVLFAGDDLAAPLQEDTFYYVIDIDAPSANRRLRVASVENGPAVNITTTGTSSTLIPPFDDGLWVQLERVITKHTPGATGNVGNTTFAAITGIAPNNIAVGDSVGVYVNGFSVGTYTVNGAGNVVIPATQDTDLVTIVKEIVEPTDDEQDFDPTVTPSSSTLTQKRRDYNYTVRNVVDEFNQTAQRYYFWVRRKTTRSGTNPSLASAEQTLREIPTPFIVPAGYVDQETKTINGTPNVYFPRRYTQCIIRGLAGIVDDDDRYVLRFTHDFTLRDEFFPRSNPAELPAAAPVIGQQPLDLKTLHSEWTLLRPGQPTKIPRSLWDKITEAVIGRKLNDPTIRVPSFAREAYDAEFGTQTRFGLEDQQAFVNGRLALATVLDDLTDPTNDFAPIDINVFFQNNETLTEGGLISFFDTIYNTFTVKTVNRIFFKVLLDALSTKDRYPGVFKTSFVTLEGRQRLQTEALING
jgi:hypothetical protein